MHIRSRSNMWSAARKRCVRALTTKSTVDPRELEQFGRLAHEWWRPHSSTFAALHSFNDVRVPFVERVAVHAGLENGLENAKTLDVGCGGGILSEVRGNFVPGQILHSYCYVSFLYFGWQNIASKNNFGL